MGKYFNFIYLEHHDFVFAYVPKVACTNWKCLFRYMVGETDYLDTQKAHDREQSGFSFLSDIANYDQILADEGIKKYCFVRNPFSRVLSAYLNKIKPFAIDNAPRERAPHFHNVYLDIEKFRVQNFPREQNANLFVFLNWIRSSGHWQATNHHWIPQEQILYLDQVNYDFMGRFEDIESDANHLLQMMGCDLKFPTQSKIGFAPTRANDKLSEIYSPREIQLVQKMYAKDFELLGYSPTISDS